MSRITRRTSAPTPSVPGALPPDEDTKTRPNNTLEGGASPIRPPPSTHPSLEQLFCFPEVALEREVFRHTTTLVRAGYAWNNAAERIQDLSSADPLGTAAELRGAVQQVLQAAAEVLEVAGFFECIGWMEQVREELDD
jgi:hypothetical protein